jgi:2-methylcitrate dehydratase PrpD
MESRFMPEKEAERIDLESRLLDHLSGVQYEDLPEAVVSYCKLLIVDALGVTFPGSRAPGCQAVIALTKSWGADSGSRVLIHGHRTTPPLAALANSTMMHALDFDDTLDASALHTFVSVLPAALVVAESAGPIDGKRLIAALVLGVDLICRLSLGIRRPLSWIRTATCGSFGAAATAGILLGLDRDALANALGIVYSQTSGNAQGLLEGRLVKRMQPGFAAQAGVLSAFLARSGITGSRHFLQGAHGFYRLYERDEYDPDPVVAALGDHYTILDLSIKPYPCCRMTHASIDASIELRDRIGEPISEIEEIVVTVSKMVTEMVGKPFVIGTDPQVDAQFSIPYTVSTALLRGDVFLEDFDTKRVCEGSARQLSQRVTVEIDPALTEKDITRSTVTVKMKNGQDYRAAVPAPLGNPSNPLDMARCQEKFTKCLAYSKIDYDESRSRELLSVIETLEHIQDVGIITTLMEA